MLIFKNKLINTVIVILLYIIKSASYSHKFLKSWIQIDQPNSFTAVNYLFTAKYLTNPPVDCFIN